MPTIDDPVRDPRMARLAHESASHTAAAQRLALHRRVLEHKAVLRTLYDEWNSEILSRLIPGRTLEVGSGPASLKDSHPDTLSTDIVWCHWLDAVMDAQCLALVDGSFSNIVLCDVLHHLPCPRSFFREAARILASGGRIVILDPYISPFSRVVNALFHPEPVDLRVDPLSLDTPDGKARDRDPFEANQAFATVLFWKDLDRSMARLESFSLVSRARSGLLRYPLSGGFGHPALLPARAFPYLVPLERWLTRFAALLAFRTLVVLERR